MRLLEAVIAVAAGAVISVPVSVSAQVVEDPSWTRGPDEGLTRSLVPGFAGWLGINGSAEVSCVVVADGHQFGCRVESEAPHGLGFGAAARLIIASAQVRGRRVDGVQVPGRIRTTVHFAGDPLEERDWPWTGPEPTAVQLRLARQIIERREIILPEGQRSLDGLDFDRLVIVQQWLTELLPLDEERFLNGRALQLARLFSEQVLKRLLANQSVDWPSDEDFSNAVPAWTPQETDAVRALRQRYCERYDCTGVDKPVP